MNAVQRREELCIWLVKEILFGNLTPEQEQAAHRVYRKLQMKNCAELEFLSPINHRRKTYEAFKSKSA